MTGAGIGALSGMVISAALAASGAPSSAAETLITPSKFLDIAPLLNETRQASPPVEVIIAGQCVTLRYNIAAPDAFLDSVVVETQGRKPRFLFLTSEAWGTRSNASAPKYQRMFTVACRDG
jgi:hypothetical protein